MFVYAVLLAAVSAIGLAIGTHLQHRAVRSQSAPTTDGGGAAVLGALRQRSWLLGMGVIVVATLLNIVALGLAPIALVQPVGALSLVCAALISARVLRVRLGRKLIGGIAVSVVSVGAFIALSSGYARDAHPTSAQMYMLAGLMASLLAVAAVVARAAHGHLPRVIVAGVLFGTVASAVHIVVSEVFACFRGAYCVASDPKGGLLPLVVLLVLLIAASALGEWLVQTAYASGPPETVLASLTVIDPIVAVLVGAAILGEYVLMPVPVIIALALAGLAACVGIAMIVRNHPGHLGPAKAVDAPTTVISEIAPRVQRESVTCE